MQNQEKFFFEGHRSTFCIKMPFGIGHPHLHIKCSLHVCRRVQGSQIFRQNSIISIRSKVMAFLVISLSLWSTDCPRGPHIVPVIMVVPMLSLCHPHHPHIIPIAPRRSHVVSMAVVSVVSMVSTPCCPRCPRGLHVMPVVPTSSPSSLHHPTSSRRFPYHPQLFRYPLHPPSSPWGWGPQISKNAIRFELIEIF